MEVGLQVEGDAQGRGCYHTEVHDYTAMVGRDSVARTGSSQAARLTRSRPTLGADGYSRRTARVRPEPLEKVEIDPATM